MEDSSSSNGSPPLVTPRGTPWKQGGLSLRRLTVDIVGAQNLLPKDGHGSSDPYCVVDFDKTQKKTATKFQTLNPMWNEAFTFPYPHTNNARGGASGLRSMPLEVSVFTKANGRPVFLGRLKKVIQLHGETSGVSPRGQEQLTWLPLERKGLLPLVRGEIGVKIYYEEEELTRLHSHSNSLADEDEEHSSRDAKARPEKLTQLQELWATAKHSLELVQSRDFLFVTVVKAQALLAMDPGGTSDPYVELKLGTKSAKSKRISKTLSPEWNECFAFALEEEELAEVKELAACEGDSSASTMELEVTIWDDDFGRKDDYLGSVTIPLGIVKKRLPGEPKVEAQWFHLEEKKGKRMAKGEIKLAVWIGSQKDEAFRDAWHSDLGSSAMHVRSRVYEAPRMWYLRVHVVEVQDLQVSEQRRLPEPFVRVRLGDNQRLQTRVSVSKSMTIGSTNAEWREDLLFVVAEPFQDQLQFQVIDELGPNREDILANTTIPITSIEKRLHNHPVGSRWVVLERLGKPGMRGRLHLRMSLDGGYHVTDESNEHRSCFVPTVAMERIPPVAIVELGLLQALNLLPLKSGPGRSASMNAYCVAKYGRKWVRTRTIVNSLSPKWNEQYSWEVYDPSTVLTVGVFDNRNVHGTAITAKDVLIGKIRLRLSTLESNRVYSHGHPLLALQPSGVKKMGELLLAVRVSVPSSLRMVKKYVLPPLPMMHYTKPIPAEDSERLRVTAIALAGRRLSRAEPPLRPEVMHAMLDTEEMLWSMRRSKANFNRIKFAFSDVIAFARWFDGICRWQSPQRTLIAHALFGFLVYYPGLILPTFFLYLFMLGIWRYRYRPPAPAFMDARLSGGDEPEDADDVEEEVADKQRQQAGISVAAPIKSYKLIKRRYERLKAIAAWIQIILGQVATAGERAQALLSWRDPRASAIFSTLCLFLAILLYIVPFRILVFIVGLFIMRHPRLRNPSPAAPVNFFMRLPSLADRMI